MDLIVITHEEAIEKEIETCEELLRRGISRLHIRKPKWSHDEMQRFISKFKKDYYKRISLHGNHDLVEKFNLGGKHYSGTEKAQADFLVTSKSFHSIIELREAPSDLTYVFLSPIYNSISKEGYQAGFDFKTLKEDLKSHKTPVFALGGITPEKLNEVKFLGFDGAVLKGIIWNQKGSFKQIEMAEKALNA